MKFWELEMLFRPRVCNYFLIENCCILILEEYTNSCTKEFFFLIIPSVECNISRGFNGNVLWNQSNDKFCEYIKYAF